MNYRPSPRTKAQDEPHSFLFQLFPYATPEEAAELNAALAEEIVSHDDLMEDPGLRFIPMFVGVDDTWR